MNKIYNEILLIIALIFISSKNYNYVDKQY